MGITTRFYHWNHAHQSFLLLVVRVVLGLILLAKGIFFISNAGHLRHLILTSRFEAWVGFLTAYITFAHLFGGVFIIIGLLTRLAVIMQIPILLGALFFILPQQSMDAGSGFILSLIVLGLLIFILIKGSGEISMDDYLKKYLL